MPTTCAPDGQLGKGKNLTNLDNIRIVFISACDMHTLATTDLAVNGQLGQGDRTNRAKSTLIEGDLAGQAVVIRDSNFTNAAVTECNER